MTGVTAVFTANAIFEGTNSGLKRSVIGSLTGDAVLSADVSSNVSIFGNEIPIVSEYESIKPMMAYAEVMEIIDWVPNLRAYTSIVSAAAKVSINGFQQSVPLFGVDPESYLSVCRDIEIEYGDIGALETGGVFLNVRLAENIENTLGRSLEIGEPVLFSMYVGNSFRLRKAPFAGVHRYIGSSEVLDRVVLADLVTVRSLANYTLGFSQRGDSHPEETAAAEDGDDVFDMDSLFLDNNDVQKDNETELDLTSLEAVLADTAERDSLVLTDNGAWSFILLSAEEGQSAAMIRGLRDLLQESGIDGVRCLSWRHAAGSMALNLMAIQTVFYIGLGFLALGAILVIMNALVISVLERTNEIGTMRSLGAPAGFIRRLFVAESLILTMGATFLGICLGIVITLIIGRSGLRLDNPLLVTLFGGSSIQPVISFNSVLLHAGVALIVGAIAWVYPVALAIRIQPLAAMNKE